MSSPTTPVLTDDEPVTVSITLTRVQWRWLRGLLQATILRIILDKHRDTAPARAVIDAQAAFQRQMPPDVWHTS